MNVVIFWVCAGMVGAVFGFMLYSVATFQDITPSRIASRQRRVMREVLWALVPMVIFVLAAMPVVASIAEGR